MVPNPNQVVKPETEGVEKVETKPVLKVESENMDQTWVTTS